MAYADNNFNRHDDNDDRLLIVPSLRGRGKGGGDQSSLNSTLKSSMSVSWWK